MMTEHINNKCKLQQTLRLGNSLEEYYDPCVISFIVN